MMKDVIVTQNLTKMYGDKAAVSSMDMHVKQGDIYGFIGRNGSGKSTTLKMLCGLAFPTQGSIRVFGQSLSRESVRKRIGVLIESPGLEGGRSAYENMYLKASLMGIVDPDKEIRELLTLTGLNPDNKKLVKRYSMGMKQRLGIAMALLGGPDLLILDEPINGLDPEGMNQLRSLLVDLNQKKGVTILVSSHILGELSKMATRYGIIKDGCLVKEISKEELSAECKDYLYLKTSDSKMAAVLLEEKLRIRNYEVRPEGEIRIYQKADSGQITTVMTSAGISVFAIYGHQQDLEGYFLDLMGKESKTGSSKKGGRRHA
ncbi:MAG TPA: ATP-binding cassette domain-containing protein [Candidatus Blautia pullistercoris]|uniref:ATP-binding cassette domain-containing protein n=1 Tax=Candidatus Blautia pullistercoris TaxID=2838499 RepID=A0A9D1VMP4_9FIRM|nr:ATP-binding cassette domain-containing protein [Candidatus Blautia pullistercoris]